MKDVVVLANLFYPVMDAPSAVIDKYLKSLKDEYEFYIISKTDRMGFKPSNEYDISYIASFRQRLLQKAIYNLEGHHYVVIYKCLYYLIRLSMVIQAQ